MRGGSGGTQTKTSFFTVNVTIVPLILVSGLKDIIFTAHTARGPNQTVSDLICIYRNNTGTYSILPAGDGTGGAFTLTNTTDTLAYTATWNDGNSVNNLTAKTLLTTRQNVFTVSVTCNFHSNDNETIAITLLGADMDAVSGGTYIGNLILLVSPE